jgi:lysophospholipase L1-like esterase
MHPRSFLPLVFLAAPAVGFTQAPVQIQPGDRILFMGDTLLEREGAAAALETRLVKSAAGVPMTVRNLSFSADLPSGVSRASFDPANTGKERIREQLALVKPTVAVLGYGMAASLEEVTYGSGDPNLNADPARYGREFSATKFKADLGALMDDITTANDRKPVRFILLAPLKHEDLRKQRPGLPDSARHNEILAGYTAAIRQLAAERGARFVDTPTLVQGGGAQPLTDNGIHPTPEGLDRWAEGVAAELGWAIKNNALSNSQTGALRKALQRKNELFFHRWRPANHTYIYGFRKREQGRNAVETEQFDALLAQADAAIAELRAGKPAPAEKVVPPDALGAEPVGKPDFQLGDGLEISLWAENPLLSKPVQMNWDAKGRLWVASTPIYPQIQPGAYATDRIFI